MPYAEIGINKHKKKKKSYKAYAQGKKKINTLIEKKSRKRSPHSQQLQFANNKRDSKSISSVAENVESGEITYSSNEKQARTN